MLNLNLPQQGLSVPKHLVEQVELFWLDMRQMEIAVVGFIEFLYDRKAGVYIVLNSKNLVEYTPLPESKEM